MGSKVGAPEKLIVNGKRLDGRKLNEMRKMDIKIGVIPNADGSSIVTLGGTKVICSVYGPKEVLPRRNLDTEQAFLNCVYGMASFSTPERVRPGPNRRSTEIGKVIADALAPAIFMEKYAGSEITIIMEVINANAGTRTAAINAASVALADAGIEMRDLVCSIASGKADGQLMLDLFEAEDNFGEADMPLAVLPRTKEITLLQMDGMLSTAEIKKLTDMSMKACEELYKLQKKALQEKYETEKDASE